MLVELLDRLIGAVGFMHTLLIVFQIESINVGVGVNEVVDEISALDARVDSMLVSPLGVPGMHVGAILASFSFPESIKIFSILHLVTWLTNFI